MCGGVLYQIDGQEFRTYFPNPKARLPILKRDGSVERIAWGRRREQTGRLPLGGWARHESILAGTWDKYNPRPIKIAVLAFMEKDHLGKSYWFEVTSGQYLQGLVVRDQHILRVYVVTIEPNFEDAVHNRWPRLI